MVSEALIEVKRWSGLACEGLRALLERLVGARRRAASARMPWHALLAPRRSGSEGEVLLRWPSGRADGLEVMGQALGAEIAFQLACEIRQIQPMHDQH